MERIFQRLKDCDGRYSEEMKCLKSEFKNWCTLNRQGCEHCVINDWRQEGYIDKSIECFSVWLSEEVDNISYA